MVSFAASRMAVLIFCQSSSKFVFPLGFPIYHPIFYYNILAFLGFANYYHFILVSLQAFDELKLIFA